MPRKSRSAVGDPALARDVRDCIAQLVEQEPGRRPTTEGVLELLMENRKYHRKPMNALRIVVRDIVAASRQAAAGEDGDGDASMEVPDVDEPSRKRPRPDRLSSGSNSGILNSNLYGRKSAEAKKAKRQRRSQGTDKEEKKAWAPKTTIPNVMFSDLGGIDACLNSVLEQIGYPLLFPQVYTHLGVEPPRGILLHGPSGCGKTRLAHAIAGEFQVPFQSVSAPELVSGVSGESEEKIRATFAAAVATAPSIIFIDEVDVIAPKRSSSQRSMDKRIVAQLLTCWDELTMEHTGNKPVMVIGATSRPDAIDAGLRRAGRFDREICLPIPDEPARADILRVMTANLKLGSEVDFKVLARMTPGYVGADLAALTKEAAVVSVKRAFGSLLDEVELPEAVGEAAGVVEGEEESKGDSTASSLEEAEVVPPADIAAAATAATAAAAAGATEGAAADDDNKAMAYSRFSAATRKLRAMHEVSQDKLAGLRLTMDDFKQAVSKVQPSATREGFGVVPDVSWEDVGALNEVRRELKLSVVFPIQHPERYASLGVKVPAGVLLYGPPGCGKTLLAKAVANESRANFISIKGPELLDKYVGESERAVRQTFQKARASAPCVVFFDELDALAPKRGSNGGSGGVSERVVNQLLTELDGLNTRGDVFVIAATNRPDIIDSAMLRPGRLDKMLYVPLPTADERAAILRTVARKTPLAPDVDLNAIARADACERFSGADLAGLLREAAMSTIRETMPVDEADEDDDIDMSTLPTDNLVHARHFHKALQRVRPSVTRRDERRYNALHGKLRYARSAISEATPSTPVPDAGAPAPADGAPLPPLAPPAM